MEPVPLSIINTSEQVHLEHRNIFVRLPCQADGGYYLFPDFSEHQQFLSTQGIESSEQWATYLFNQFRVATLPDSVFGMEEKQFCLRLAFVDFEGAKSLTSYQQFARFKDDEKLVQQLIPKLYKATQLICNWLQANC